MHKRIHLRGYTIQYWYLGTATGGFSETYAPGIGDHNLSTLRYRHKAASSTLMVPTPAHEVRVVPSDGAVLPAAALITTTLNHGLLLRPADCIPLLLYSANKPCLGLVHCGRRELEANIIEKTLYSISKTFGV